jgi:hypothetical protein
MGERTGTCRLLVGGVQGRKPLIRLGVDGSIILKWIFKKWCGVMGLHRPGSGKGQALLNAVMNFRIP